MIKKIFYYGQYYYIVINILRILVFLEEDYTTYLAQGRDIFNSAAGLKTSTTTLSDSHSAHMSSDFE